MEEILEKLKSYLDKKEKLSFADFNCALLLFGEITEHDRLAIYSPILYSLEEEYFTAVVKFLLTKQTTNLVGGGFCTDDIIKSYKLDKSKDYLTAVMIFNSLVLSKEEWPLVHFPYTVE